MMSSQMKAQSARRAKPEPIITDADESDSTEATEDVADDETREISRPAPPTRSRPGSTSREFVEENSRLRESRSDEATSDEPRRNEARVARNPAVPIPARQLHEPDESPRTKGESRPAGPGVLFTAESPVLSVEAVGPNKVMIGREAQFIVKVRNAGAAANNLVVMVNVPSFAEVTALETSVGAIQPPAAGTRREPLAWKIDRLDAKASETLTLRLIPRKSTPLDLGVQWTFTPEASQTLVEVQEPKLVMTITGPDEILFGQSKIYKLTVSNPGNGDTENVVVGLMPIGRASEGTATHRLGTLRAARRRSIDIELTARQAGAISIKAQAFADGGLRTEAAEQVLVRRANLKVDVEAPKVKYAGTTGTYHVKVANAGNATAENVHVSAMLPPDAKYVSSTGGGRLEPQQGKITWSVGTLQPGGQRVFEMQCSLAAPGENRLQFIAMAEGDLSAAATANTHVEALADLKLEVRDPQGPIAVGEDAIYEVQIRNRGTKAAERIDLAVFFSEGLEAVTAEGAPHEISPGQVVFKPIAKHRPFGHRRATSSGSALTAPAIIDSGPKSSANRRIRSWLPKRPRNSTATTPSRPPTHRLASPRRPRPTARAPHGCRRPSRPRSKRLRRPRSSRGRVSSRVSRFDLTARCYCRTRPSHLPAASDGSLNPVVHRALWRPSRECQQPINKCLSVRTSWL